MYKNSWEDHDMMPDETEVESKKNPLLLLLIPVVVLALVLIGIGGVLLARGSQDSGYAKSLEQAELAQKNGDIDAAIEYYLEAIEAEPSDPEPYLEAATLYEEMGEIQKAVDILGRGVENTSSARIQYALDYLLRDQEGKDGIELLEKDETEVETAGAWLNESFLLFVSGAASGDFDREYGENEKTLDNGITTVSYTNSPVCCYYSQTPDGATRPVYVSVSDLTFLFPGMSDTISFAEIQALTGVTEATKTDSEAGSTMEFKAAGCLVSIECDGEGIAQRNAANQIHGIDQLAEEPQEEEVESCKLTGTVIDATTGQGVSATLKFHEGTSASGDVVLEADADSYGYYEATLTPGDYVIEIVKEGYITEYFEQTVYSWIPEDTADFVISPELAEGEIRIVLEWGGAPSDLDSHLIGTASDGRSVHMFFGNPRYDGICELDVDDTNGYGPETTTIYDIHGDYEFAVYDYNDTGTLGMGGATVKIYMPGESAPVIVSVPSTISNAWRVCSFHDGALTIHNEMYWDY